MARPTELTSSQSAPELQAASQSLAFERAERHSHKVRFLKTVLPVLAFAMAAAFAGYSYLATPKAVSVSADGAAYSDGKLVMANPKLDGFTKDNRPYNMTAARAIQDFQNEGIVELEGINAKLPVNNDNWASVTAPSGTYDRDKNTLDINGVMTITTSDGMVAKFKSAYLDIGTGGMKTDDAVDIQLKGTEVTSDSLTVLENGKVMIFENRVRMNIDPRRLKTAQNTSGDQDVVQ
ncbi:LPS export ABC transporter periplasmic protein LptC [Borborobacter arsenicus]|nr:LPS export ABC transporter periplasmic protein LptC [Pseudaminobacter arsenicus]